MYSSAHLRRTLTTGKIGLVSHNTAPELLANHSPPPIKSPGLRPNERRSDYILYLNLVLTYI